MFDEKIAAALKFIEDEIDFTYGKILEYSNRAKQYPKIPEDNGIRMKIKQEADKWQCRYAGLLKTHSRFLKEIEP